MDPLLLKYRSARLLAFAVFVFVAYAPVAGALSGVLSEPAVHWSDVVSLRRAQLLANSLAFSSAISAFTMVAGALSALAILQFLPRSARRLQWLMLASIALPPTVPALAWSHFFALLSSLTGSGAVGSWLHAGLAQAMAVLPFATGLSMAALRDADPELVDAGRINASPGRVLLRITLPLAAPTLVSGAALIFLLSLLDYTIPSIFGVNVYSLEIFVAFGATRRIADAFWLSLPLVACALAMVALLSGLPRRLAQSTDPVVARKYPLPWALNALIVLCALASGAALLAPLLSLLPAFADPTGLGRTVAASWREARYTLVTSGLSSLIALALALGPAVELARGGRSRQFLWMVCLMPFLVPPAFTGIGLIALWSPVHSVDIYGSLLMTVAAELSRFTPIAIVVLSTWMLRTDFILIDAALIAGTSLRRAMAGVVIPLAAPGLISAAGIAFVLSLGEIGANLLVTPAGEATLTMKAYNYLHYGGSQAAAGLCLLLMALAGLGAAFPAWVIKRTANAA